MRLACAAVLAVGVLALVAPSLATAGGIADLPARAWQPNGAVNVVAPSPDGSKLYLGGSFDYVGPDTGSSAKVDASTAAISGAWPKFNGQVNVIVPDGQGGWIVGGSFTSVSGVTSHANLVRITSIGTVDLSWGSSTNFAVNDIEVAGADVYIGGDFTTYSGGAPGAGRVAKLALSNGAIDPTYTLGSGFSGSVKSIDVDGGWLYVGGSFGNYNGVTVNNLARLSATTGVRDTSWVPSGATGGLVAAVFANAGEVYVGGQFTSVGGLSHNAIAKIDAAGTVLAWDPVLNSNVTAIVGDATRLYVAGDFTSVNATSRSRVASIMRTSGTLDATFAGPSFTGAPATLAFDANYLYVGGPTVTSGHKNIARLNITTGVVDAWNPTVANGVLAIVPTVDGVILGGTFTSLGGVVRANLAALDLGSGDATAWNPTGVSGAVTALAPIGSRVYAAHATGAATTASVKAYAASGTGTAVAGFTPVTVTHATSANVAALVVDEANSALYLGGQFSNAASTTHTNLAAVALDTGLNQSGFVASAGGNVRAMELYAGTLYVGGLFASVNGGPARNNAAAFVLPNGSTPTGWNPNTNGEVTALRVDGTRVYLGGEFTLVNGITARTRLAAVDLSTGTADSWAPTANGTITGIAPHPGAGSVLVTGQFTTLNGMPRISIGNLAAAGIGTTDAWNPNGSVPSFNSPKDVRVAGGRAFVAADKRVGLFELSNQADAGAPVLQIAGIDEPAPGSPTDGVMVASPTQVVVRPQGGARSFTINAKAWDPFDSANPTYADASGLDTIDWPAIPASGGTWTPTGAIDNARPRGLKLHCWTGNAFGAYASAQGVAYDRAIDYGSVKMPDTLPNLPASLAWNGGAGATATSGNVDNFSCRWNGYLIGASDLEGGYHFRSTSDQGFGLNVDGLGGLATPYTTLSDMTAHGINVANNATPVPFIGGEARSFTADWFDDAGTAQAKLEWQYPTTGTWAVIPEAAYVSDINYSRTYSIVDFTGYVHGASIPLQVTARDRASTPNVVTRTVNLEIDGAAPGANITTAPGAGATNAMTVGVTTTDSADSGAAGVKDRQLEHEYAAMSGGVCPAPTSNFTPATTVYTGTSTRTFNDSTAAEGCYRWRYRSTDNVGNTNAITANSSAWTIVDHTAPTGGSLASPSGIMNTAGNLPVAVTLPTDSGVGLNTATTQLYRASATYASGLCGGFGTYSPVGSTGIGDGTWTDTSTVDGMCYRYRLDVSDLAGNPFSVASPGTTMVDTTPPTGTITSPSATIVNGVITVAGTGSDTGSGATTRSIVFGGASGGTVCPFGSLSAGSYSCTWDTTAVPDGNYTISVNVFDAANNTVTLTRSIVVDNTGPSLVFNAFTPVTGAAYQHVDGADPLKLWYNPAQAGSFSLDTVASDAGTGVQSVAFPALGSGWTPAGGVVDSVGPPWSGTFGWATGANNPGVRIITATDVAGNTATASVTLSPDGTAPSAGSIAYPNGVNTTANLTIGSSVDALSGIGSVVVQRRSTATVTPTTCDTANWSAWTTVATNPPASFTDSGVVVATCYQYQLIATDHVANSATSTSPNTLITDTPGLLVTQTGGSTDVAEGGASDTFTLELRSPPTANVTVAITGNAEVSATPSPLTFTPANWSVPQTVTVSAVNDSRDETSPMPVTVAIASSSSDANYASLTASQVVNVTDDDVASVLVTPTSGLSVSEGNAASTSYDVKLTSQPSGNVTVSPSSDGQTSVSPPSLTFTPANWSAVQTVTVSAVDDPDLEGPHTSKVVHAVASSDASYANAAASAVMVAVADDDAAGLVVTSAAGAEVDEANLADTEPVGVRLTSRPSGPVTVAATGVAGQLATSPATLSFTPANWNTAQTVTVSAVDDSTSEPNPHAAQVSLAATSANDPRWAAAGASIAPIKVRDNDVAVATIKPPANVTRTATGSIALTEGSTAGVTLTLRLGGDPTSDVVVTPQASPRGQLVFVPGSVTIPAGSHDQTFTFTVRAANDDDTEAALQDVTVNWVITTSDPMYGATPLEPVIFGVADDDVRTTRETTPDPTPPTNTTGGGTTSPQPPTDNGTSQPGPTNPTPPGDTGPKTDPTPQGPAPTGDGGSSTAKSDTSPTDDGSDERDDQDEPKQGVAGAINKTKKWAAKHKATAATAATATVSVAGAVAAKVAGGAAVKGLGGSLLSEPTSIARRVLQNLSPTGGEHHGPHRPGGRAMKKLWRRLRGRGGVEEPTLRRPKVRRTMKDLLPPEPDPGFELDLDSGFNADAGFELDLDADAGSDAGFRIDLDDVA